MKKTIKLTKTVTNKDSYQRRAEKALTLASKYSHCDTADERTWVIDKMVRALCGKSYKDFVKKVNNLNKMDSWGYTTWQKGVMH